MWLLNDKAPPLHILLAVIYPNGEAQELIQSWAYTFSFHVSFILWWSIIVVPVTPKHISSASKEPFLTKYWRGYGKGIITTSEPDLRFISGERIHSFDMDIQLPTVVLHSEGMTAKSQSLHSLTRSFFSPFFCFLFCFCFCFFFCISSSHHWSLSTNQHSQKYPAASLRIMPLQCSIPQSVCAVHSLFYIYNSLLRLLLLLLSISSSIVLNVSIRW